MRDAKTAIICGWLFGLWTLAAVGPATAAIGDCAQPQTSGSQPTATDCLVILGVAIGTRTCDPFPACVCAPKGTLPTTATDTLVCLAATVDGTGMLACPCEPATTTTDPSTTTTTTTTTTSTTSTTIPPVDLDGDGWGVVEGDCCDTPEDGCSVPALVNPGAFDFAGDGIDEDCNGTPDDGDRSCDDGLSSGSSSAADYSRALDLCSETTESPPRSQRRYGLIAAAFSLADGSGVPAPASRAIRTGFGGVAVRRGEAMVVFSTGHAAAPDQLDPSFSPFQPGATMGTLSGVPEDWLAANGGSIPTAPGCAAIADTTARDAVMLKLRVRVPTNARSFRLSANVLTSEFPEWVCGAYNDQLVVLLDSAADENPADKNVAVYVSPANERYPVGVNLANDDTGLFRQCRNGVIGCNTVESSIATCTDTSELVGSGFDEAGPGCDAADTVGGGTGWLTLRGNVSPGEVVELRIGIWDSGDAIYDTVVILDDLRWDPDPTVAGAGL